MFRRSSVGFLFLLACALWITTGNGRAQTTTASPLTLDHLEWRHIGPASFGGRIDDIEAVAGNPSVIFVGTASGGVFKTVNNGVTWMPVFDRDATALSIGDIAIAPSDPNLIWVGTGEPNNRQSSSWGDGVYKSLDGGETWNHMGLRATHHVGRVAIHPSNPDVVFVAAMGHLWGPNSERGLYRTKDAGKTWQKVLSVNDDTGVGDVAIDADGRTLYAAAYQRRRRGFGFVGGGPGSALYRSLDGGDTWDKPTRGLPTGDVGRIGLDISRSRPNIVYAVIEHKTKGGVYRSDDRGTTWTHQGSMNPRPSYYSQIRVDPKNPDKVWMLGSFAVSLDAGKTFHSEHTSDRIHTDHHALWIDPANPDHLLLGNDGGLYFSYDGAKNWQFVDNLPIGQYYDVDVDTRDPYWIYGGTQDNGTWGIPSRTSSLLGITNADVVNIAYGDGFYVAIDPRDHRTIYANSQSGRTYLVDLETREEQGLRPVPKDPKEIYRFNWSSPMLLSPHDAKVVYYGGNKLFKTVDRGHVWQPISPDLTRNQDWKKLPLMGPERSDDTLSRDDGVSDYGTISTIAESPLQAGVLYVGTDDGNVHVTRDAGATWQNLTTKFKLAGPRWVSRVIASPHDPGTAYVSFDGHQDDDFTPYVFKTADFGATWTSVAGDLPAGMVVHALAEHPRNRNLLLAGTEFGLFVSHNGGKSWTLVKGNLPRVRIDDILVTPRDNDLILGTHGRSIIVLDDVILLEKTDAGVLSEDVHLFPTRPATEYYEMRMLPSPGAAKYSGPNPPYGALITYYLKTDPTSAASGRELATAAASGRELATAAASGRELATAAASGRELATAAESRVKIKILDNEGHLVRELDGPDRRGYNRVAWDLRYPLTFVAGDQDEGWFGPPRGPLVLPGEYRISVTARGRELTGTVQVRTDPRARTSAEALQARFAASQRVADLARAFAEGVQAVDGLTREIDAIKKGLVGRDSVSKTILTRVDDVSKKVDGLKTMFKAGFGGPKFKYLDLAGQLQASTSAPTEAQMTTIEHLTAELTDNISSVNAVIATEMPHLETELRGSNLNPFVVKPVAVPSVRK
jgi:photosystem II stability/assembly factor-like uncharacterized protein